MALTVKQMALAQNQPSRPQQLGLKRLHLPPQQAPLVRQVILTLPVQMVLQAALRPDQVLQMAVLIKAMLKPARL
jgi:hypothetical protein